MSEVIEGVQEPGTEVVEVTETMYTEEQVKELLQKEICLKYFYMVSALWYTNQFFHPCMA